MKNLIKSEKFRSGLLSALMVTGAYVVANILGADDALAQSRNIGEVLNRTTDSVKEAAGLVYTGAYVGGTTALMMGAFKLKAHAENPGQTPMAHGLGRLAVGAGLIALPSVGQTILGTTGNNTTDSINADVTNVGID
jgi:hypothetical protein